MKIKYTLIAVIILVLAAVYFLAPKREHKEVIETTAQSLNTILKNSTFTIDKEIVVLKDGVSEEEIASGSASKITTRYFGNTSTGDLTFDGKPDTAFLITRETGGSGLFFYVVVAVKTDTSYRMTNAFFVGDRIAPQNTEIISNELRINYAERRSGEPMTAQPSQGATLLLKVTPNNVLEGLMY